MHVGSLARFLRDALVHTDVDLLQLLSSRGTRHLMYSHLSRHDKLQEDGTV